ncbi:MAG: tetratricopeptide repeat protein [Pseudomonadota bacterium]|nr:tetratricopeptide repeat protein [Pseudomonadota bacterium]
MIKVLPLLLFSLLLSACSVWDLRSEPEKTLADIPQYKVRLLSNEPLHTSHDDVMEHYRRYLQVADDTEMRIRVAHRMANLTLQAEEQALAWQAENRPPEETDSAGVVSTAERSLAVGAVRDYERLLAAYPDRSDNDALLYQLARAYRLAGRTSAAIVTLQQLVRQYPRSVYYLESEFRLGQLLYERADYQQAAGAYQRLRDYGAENNQYYTSAGYLLGWSIFKQGDTEASLLSFSALLDEEYPDETALQAASGSRLDMLNDILRIMAVMFDDLGDWNQIARFYDEHGPRHFEYLIYDRLATLYYDKHYYKSGASTLRAFVLRYPDSERAPVYYQRLIEGYQQARYPALTRKHKTLFAQRFGVGSDYWNQHGQVVRGQLSVPLQAYLWDLAGFWHAWGQSAQAAADKNERLLQAVHWYGEYIRSFPHADDTVKAHFLLAEAAFSIGDYRLAAQHYEIVAYQYPRTEQAAEAGYAALLAYQRYRPAADEKMLWHQATAASAMRFVQEFPQDKRRGTVLVNSAEMLLADHYYRQALTSARSAQSMKDSLAERYRYGAALVQGHAAFELGYFAEAEQALFAAQQYRDSGVQNRRQLREKVAASIYKQGESARAAGDVSSAVAHWRRIAQVIPESDTRIIAEYDAAALLMSVQDYDQAIDVLLAFRRQYPQHRLTEDIPSKLIVAYEAQGEWRKAAFELQRIWKNSRDRNQQRIACFQAAEYFAKAGDTDNAVVMYKRYGHSYPRPFDAAVEANYRLSQIYKGQEEEEKRRYWLDKMITLHLQAGKDQTDRSRYLAAEAAYELGEVQRRQYEAVALTLPLDKSITRKNTLLQKALQRYTQAVQIGVLEYTTSATYRIGELYHQLASGLMNSPRPDGLDDVEAEEYQFLLEDQAFPLEEAAIQVHQKNTGRTYDGLYDGWIRRSYRALAELMPGQYDKQEKALTYVDQIR